MSEECEECKRLRRLATTYRELLTARARKDGRMIQRLRKEVEMMEADLESEQFDKPNELGEGRA